MAWADYTKSMDQSCLAIFGQDAFYLPQAGGDPIPIRGIISPPPLLEESLPGGRIGVVVVYFWVRFMDAHPKPQHGDQVILNDVYYDVFEMAVDPAGGCMLKLRKRSTR